MGKAVENPCHHVISFRVNEQERKILDDWASAKGMNVSTMMRDLIKNMDEVFCHHEQDRGKKDMEPLQSPR